MALAVAEQFPGVQGCWEAAQSHVDIGSGQGCYETRWEMGNSGAQFAPSVCTDHKGVQGLSPHWSHGQFGRDGTSSSGSLSRDAVVMCSAQRHCPSGFALLTCHGQPWPGEFPVLSRAMLTSLQGSWQELLDSEDGAH